MKTKVVLFRCTISLYYLILYTIFTMSQIIHKALSYKVRGVLLDIHNQLGSIFPEAFYQEAITYGLTQQGILCTAEKQFEVIYRGIVAGIYYVDHWLEEGEILLEIKVASEIEPIHKAQALSYLKLTNADLAIIANFGAKSFQDQRLPNFLRNKTVHSQWQSFSLTQDTLINEIDKALHQVHFILGPGFIHRVYRQALMIELQYQGFSYELIRNLPIHYNDYFLGMQGVQLIKIENKVLLGAFAIKTIDEIMRLKMRVYLKQLDIMIGLLANFYGEQLIVEIIQ